MKSKYYLSIIFLCLLIGVYFLYIQNKVSKFPPSRVVCFDEFIQMIKNDNHGYNFNLPKFNMSDISLFRCDEGEGFTQIEAKGIDLNNHTFYLHYISGGMAASGSDSLFDYCQVRDGKILISEKITGRYGEFRGEGACAYSERHSDYISAYSYRKQ